MRQALPVFLVPAILLASALITIPPAEGGWAEPLGPFLFNVIQIKAGGGPGRLEPDLAATTLTLDDAEAVRQHLGDRAEFVARMAMKQGVAMKVEGKEFRCTVYAVDGDWHKAMDWRTYGMREQDRIDPRSPEGIELGLGPDSPRNSPVVQGNAHVYEIGDTSNFEVVAGAHLAAQLSEDGTVLPGALLRCASLNFQVLGILEQRPVPQGVEDYNSGVLMPLGSGLKILFKQQHLSCILVRLPAEAVKQDPALIGATAEELRQFLRQRHGIASPADDDFSVIVPLAQADATRGGVRSPWPLALGAPGILVVGGGLWLFLRRRSHTPPN